MANKIGSVSEYGDCKKTWMISLSNWRLKVSSKEKKFWVEDALNAMEVLWLVPTIVHIRRMQWRKLLLLLVSILF